MEEEISFLDAITNIKDGREVKVIYDNGEIDYIDQFDGLDGLNFKHFFSAKFYIDYETPETMQQLHEELNDLEGEISNLDDKKLDLLSETDFIKNKIKNLNESHSKGENQ